MMKRSFFLAALAVGLLACQNANDPDRCAGKCDSLDDPANGGKLMARAPYAPGTIAITRNDSGFLCEVIGPKGETVLLSDEYTSRASALNGALAIQENGVADARYDVRENGGVWSFTLLAGNNVGIADSRTFPSEAEATAAARAARELIAGIVQYKAALTHGARFDLDRAAEGSSEWAFELRDEDDQPVLVSQVYARRRDAVNGIESVRANGRDEGRYELRTSPHRFILKAANGVEIAESAQTFASAEEAQAALLSTQALLASERVANPW